MQWLDLFHDISNKVAVTVLIILVGFIIGRIAGRLIFRILHEIEIDRLISKKKADIANSVSQVIEYTIYVITVCLALDNLDILAFALIAAVVILAVILIISALLGFKDFVPNFLCGLWIKNKGLAVVDTNIRLSSVKGRVVKRGLLHIKVKTKSDDIISVPNCVVVKKKWN
ncbi:mechanosensitive ion channel [Candidatus Woesearchaeota archaeon]|nr:mechanosensitive ion channel [Candidatus Woesearchaeota archaeon]